VTLAGLAFALDLPSIDEARRMAIAVRDVVDMFKIGLELFVAEGPRAMAIGEEAGKPVFLDLKLHDIPETVERAVARASSLGARILTVHASGGPAMLRRAVERARKDAAGLQIAAVTVLTSLEAHDLASIGVVAVGVAGQVERLAVMAYGEGVRAFVCSPHEVALLRATLGPDATLLTPGVRGATLEKGDDQRRTMSAAEAVRAGSNLVIVGRPIRDAADPLVAARAIAREIDEAGRSRD
jgi:orotidine-5'-phosphate decarboxylase